MAHLQRIRKLTSVIKKVNDKTIKDHIKINLSEDDLWYGDPITKEEAIKKYSESGFLRSVGLHRARSIYKEALKLGYIEEKPKKYVGDSIKVFITDDKGVNITQRRLGMPTGYWRDFLKDNAELLKVLGLIATIIVCVATVINVIILGRQTKLIDQAKEINHEQETIQKTD